MTVAVGVIDLGTGNLFSVLKGLERVGGAPVLVRSASEIAACERLVLPGVGSFADASQRAHGLGLASLLGDHVGAGKPALGICLGMQLLFDEGEEDGLSRGLGLIPGRVVKLRGGPDVTVPHVGWQRVECGSPSEIGLFGVEPWFYFSHSYRADTDAAHVVATATHGEAIPAIVRRGALVGIQPHPEKSGPAGAAFLRAFLETGVRS